MYIQDFVIFNDNCLFMCIVPWFVSAATLVQFVYFVILIRLRLQLIGELLADNRRPVVFHVGQVVNVTVAAKSQKLELRVIQTLYGKLHKALDLLNSVFGVQLVVMLTILFITLTTLSYYICMQVIR